MLQVNLVTTLQCTVSKVEIPFESVIKLLMSAR